jgi:hypothetical protein
MHAKLLGDFLAVAGQVGLTIKNLTDLLPGFTVLNDDDVFDEVLVCDNSIGSKAIQGSPLSWASSHVLFDSALENENLLVRRVKWEAVKVSWPS